MRAKRFFALFLIMLLVCSSLFANNALAAYDKPYYIDVDLTNQIVTIYDTESDEIVRQMLCSTGTVGHETPKGVYYLPSKDRDDERSEWYNFYTLSVYAKWATRIINGYLFHSIPCRRPNLDSMVTKYVEQFGMPASHGCVRLRVEDAEFIAKNCLRGTRVTIFESDELDEDLRSLLYISSYTNEDGMTYQEYLGVSDTDLGRGAAGPEVLDLQHRLVDLGYYGDEPDGKYDTKTISAVKKLQRDMGIAENGITSDSMLEILYSEDAPVSTGEVTLEEGNSGPVVKKLQAALQQLGVYEDELDSIYDLGVTEAIQQFQSLCGYEADGIATPEIQQAIYYQLGQLEETFGEGSIPAAEYETEEISMATVEAKAKIIIRSQKDTESSALTKVSPGDEVLVLDSSDEKWCKVAAKGEEGYMYKKYLVPFTTENVVMKFTDGSSEYIIGNTLEEKRNGEDSFADFFRDYYTSEDFISSAEESVDYATVQTGMEGVNLNLRAEPSSEAEILAELPNGTELRVLSRDEEWTRVGYEESIGYLMNQYLSFWEGSPDELGEEVIYADISDLDYDVGVVQEVKAMVVGDTRDEDGNRVRPYLYDEPKSRADKVSILEEGAEVTVLEFCEEEGWVKIQYLAQTGYMKDVSLKYEYGFEGA